MAVSNAGAVLLLIASAILAWPCHSLGTTSVTVQGQADGHSLGPTSVTVRGQAGGSYTFDTIFEPKLCSGLSDQDLAHLSSRQVADAKAIILSNFGAISKCIVVFGILVISNIPDNGNYVNDDWIRLFANTVASIMDKNKDGFVDDDAVGKLMKSRPGTTRHAEDGGTFIFGRSRDTIDAAEDAMLTFIGRTTAMHQDQDFGPDSDVGQSIRAMTEEIFHTYQHQLGIAYPEVWGASYNGCPVNGLELPGGVHFAHGAPFGRSTGNASLAFARHFSGEDHCNSPNPDAQKGCNYEQSTLMKCAYRAQCNWYTSQMCCSKTGDSASGADVTGGGCIWPTCAGVEWYYNLIFEYSETTYPSAPYLKGAGSADVGTSLAGGNAFPQSKAEVKSRLISMGGACAEVLANIENPDYHQLTGPFDWNYAPSSSWFTNGISAASSDNMSASLTGLTNISTARVISTTNVSQAAVPVFMHVNLHRRKAT